MGTAMLVVQWNPGDSAYDGVLTVVAYVLGAKSD
jgi:hypothetical protein